MKIPNLNESLNLKSVNEMFRGKPRGEAREEVLRESNLDLNDNVHISDSPNKADEGKEIGLAMLGVGITLPGIIASIGIFSVNPPAGVMLALSSLILGGVVIASANY